jgi:protein-tyrosine phosphatase
MTSCTSITHPIRIDAVTCEPHAPGEIGITFCPGKFGQSLYGALWARELDADLDAVLAWGPSVVLTLIEDHEIATLRVEGLGKGIQRRGISWQHMPIPDLCAPNRSFEEIWVRGGSLALANLRRGEKVLVHCRGGLGRAGVVACLLLVELGARPAEALQKIRAARPGAVETPAQEQYVMSYRTRFAGADRRLV